MGEGMVNSAACRPDLHPNSFHVWRAKHEPHQQVFVAMCLSVPIWDRVDPTILGLPFNLFWLLAWIPLSSASMWVAYRVDRDRTK